MLYKIEIVTFQKIINNEGVNADALFLFLKVGEKIKL